MSRDARVAHTDDRVLATEAADGRAAAAGDTFVAGLVGVVEVGATGTLEKVAAGGRHVAQLAGGAGDERAGEQAIIAPHARVGGKIGVAYQPTDAQPTLG